MIEIRLCDLWRFSGDQTRRILTCHNGNISRVGLTDHSSKVFSGAQRTSSEPQQKYKVSLRLLRCLRSSQTISISLVHKLNCLAFERCRCRWVQILLGKFLCVYRSHYFINIWPCPNEVANGRMKCLIVRYDPFPRLVSFTSETQLGEHLTNLLPVLIN